MSTDALDRAYEGLHAVDVAAMWVNLGYGDRQEDRACVIIFGTSDLAAGDRQHERTLIFRQQIAPDLIAVLNAFVVAAEPGHVDTNLYRHLDHSDALHHRLESMTLSDRSAWGEALHASEVSVLQAEQVGSNLRLTISTVSTPVAFRLTMDARLARVLHLRLR
jgi:hypothetical protein